jgi:hypothetical protein
VTTPSQDADIRARLSEPHLHQHGPSTGDGPAVRDCLPPMPVRILSAVLDRLDVGEASTAPA